MGVAGCPLCDGTNQYKITSRLAPAASNAHCCSNRKAVTLGFWLRFSLFVAGAVCIRHEYLATFVGIENNFYKVFPGFFLDPDNSGNSHAAFSCTSHHGKALG